MGQPVKSLRMQFIYEFNFALSSRIRSPPLQTTSTNKNPFDHELKLNFMLALQFAYELTLPAFGRQEV